MLWQLAASPVTAPKGKIPFGTHGSAVICDSADMIRYLLNTFSDPADGRTNAISNRAGDTKGRIGDLVLPGSISVVRAATARAAEAILEQRLYFTGTYTRWCLDEHFAVLRDLFFATVPQPIRGLVSAMVRRNVSTTMQGLGIWAHAPEDITRRAVEDWETIAALLPGSDTAPGYLGGDGPCAEDCTLFATIDNVINAPFASPVKAHLLEKQPKLVAFCDKFRTQYFPDAGPALAEVREDNKLIPIKP